MPPDQLFPRNITDRLAAALADTRVVAVVGPRQAGKSTLAGLVASRVRRSTVVTMDVERFREEAAADPDSFVRARPGLLVVDEVQRVPTLLLAIKAEVDRDPRPGRFLVTGSTHLFAVRDLGDTLAGRMELIELAPLSQGEIERRRETFVDAAFDADPAWPSTSKETRTGYLQRACAGGFPEALERSGRRRRDWYRSYVDAVVQREVRAASDVHGAGELPRILRLLAARHASILNVAALARDARMPERTVHRYIDVLAAVFLVKRIPAWSANLTAKEARAPKVIVWDAGLAAHLRGFVPTGRHTPDVHAGPILEGLVLGELQRQLGWSEIDARLHHFRDRGGIEVDAVLESDDGSIVAIEVKASTAVRRDDLASLRLMRDRLRDRFRRGVVLYTGHERIPFDDRLEALPLDAVWTT